MMLNKLYYVPKKIK